MTGWRVFRWRKPPLDPTCCLRPNRLHRGKQQLALFCDTLVVQA